MSRAPRYVLSVGLPEGTELIAELPQVDLDAAVSQLVPPGFVAGEDARTPRVIRVHRHPRERAGSVLWDLPPGLTAFDLHDSARELSRRARTIVWDSWPLVILVEYTAGEETSRFDYGHNGGWRGSDWSSIEQGEVRPPFSEGLVALLRTEGLSVSVVAGRNREFVAALIDDTYGYARKAELLATYHHAFELAPESAALAPLLRAVIARVVCDERAEVPGLGTFVFHPGPPRSIGYLVSREDINLDDWSEFLTASERTTAAGALGRLIDRLVPATDLVVPGLACFSVTEDPEYRGTNPRTGESVFVPGKRTLGVILQAPE
jgi:hypothetical protein